MKNFISFEGGEGSGKSTQINLLYKSIFEITKNVLITREPGGTLQSELIRNLIVQKQKFELDSLTELLLITAARNEHILNIILPKLKNNIVLCDRYIDSTYAYQVVGQRLGENLYKVLNKIIVKNIIPEITFYIDLDPEIGLNRTLSRKNNEVKYESLDLKFHKKVRQAYIYLSKNEKRIKLINGALSIENIHKQIIDFLNERKILLSKIPYSE